MGLGVQKIVELNEYLWYKTRLSLRNLTCQFKGGNL